MPCNDVHANMLQQEEQLIFTQQISHQHHTNDICSPFCNCQCCNTSTTKEVSLPEITIQQFSNTTKEKFTAQSNFYLYNYFQNIWQPPKIG